MLRLKHKTTPSEIAEAEDLLRSWQSSVGRRDAQLSKRSTSSKGEGEDDNDGDDPAAIFTAASVSKSSSSKRLPPVRGAAPEAAPVATKKVYTQQPPSKHADKDVASKEEKEEGERKAAKIGGYDFRAWEKYDAEAEAGKVEEFSQDFFNKAPGKTQEELQNEVSSKRAEAHKREMAQIQSDLGAGGLSELQRTTRANREKIKGNECFKIGEMEEAFACYSRSLALDASNAITYANRAMASLRLNKLELAEDDCSRSLALDGAYVKAWSRRGSTRFKRGKYVSIHLSCFLAHPFKLSLSLHHRMHV